MTVVRKTLAAVQLHQKLVAVTAEPVIYFWGSCTVASVLLTAVMAVTDAASCSRLCNVHLQ